MTKTTLIPILTVMFFVASLRAFPAQGPQRGIASNSDPRLAANEPPAAMDGIVRQPSLQHRNPRYQLTNGDVLELDFPFTPSFNQTATVMPDGFISLRVVGSVHVQGETIPELRQSLEKVYAKILQDPVITITLKEFQNPYFIVGGQVQRPGKFDLRGDTTAMQAIEIAGGFNDNAKHSQILLFRRVSNDWVEVKKLNLKQLLQAKDLSEDTILRPGDLLFVPKSKISKIKKYIPATSMGVYYNPIHY